jgi:putative FmdB family regulatory protein
MPIYEYHCERCGDFEQTQRITDPPLTKCPKCRRKVRRLISASSFHLKGSGWYVTDYARSGGKEAAKDGGGGEKTGADAKSTTSESSPKTETQTETKPAPKSGTKSETKAASGAKPGS